MTIDYTPEDGNLLKIDPILSEGIELTPTFDIKTNKDFMAALEDNKVKIKEKKEVETDVKDKKEVKEEAKTEEKKEKVIDSSRESQIDTSDDDIIDTKKEEEKSKEKEEEKPKEKEEEKPKEKEEEKPKEEEKEEVDPKAINEYRKLEDTARLESRYSVNEIIKFNEEAKKLSAPVKPEDYEELDIEDKLDYRDSVKEYNREQKSIQKGIENENKRIRFIYEQRFIKFIDTVEDKEQINKFKQWLTDSGIGRARVYSSATGDETIEEVYEDFLRKQRSSEKRKAEKREVKKQVPSKFKSVKNTPVTPVAKKRTGNSNFPLLNDPRNVERVRNLKLLWPQVKAGQEMTDKALERALENGNRVNRGLI